MAARAQGEEISRVSESEAVEAPATAPDLELLNPLPEGEANPEGVTAAFESPASPPSDSPGSSPGNPKFERWSNTRLKNAKRLEMSKRIRELETLAASKPTAAASDDPAVSPEMMTQQTVIALAGTLAVVGKIGARIRGQHWDLTPEECQALAQAWSPVLAPHLGTLAEYLPLAAALGVTAQVVWPRIERDMQLAKSGQAEPIAAVVEAAPAAP